MNCLKFDNLQNIVSVSVYSAILVGYQIYCLNDANRALAFGAKTLRWGTGNILAKVFYVRLGREIHYGSAYILGIPIDLKGCGNVFLFGLTIRTFKIALKYSFLNF